MKEHRGYSSVGINGATLPPAGIHIVCLCVYEYISGGVSWHEEFPGFCFDFKTSHIRSDTNNVDHYGEFYLFQ